MSTGGEKGLWQCKNSLGTAPWKVCHVVHQHTKNTGSFSSQLQTRRRLKRVRQSEAKSHHRDRRRDGRASVSENPNVSEGHNSKKRDSTRRRGFSRTETGFGQGVPLEGLGFWSIARLLGRRPKHQNRNCHINFVPRGVRVASPGLMSSCINELTLQGSANTRIAGANWTERRTSTVRTASITSATLQQHQEIRTTPYTL